MNHTDELLIPDDKPSHSRAMIVALSIGFLGAAFAIGASVYVWIARGQVPYATMLASLLTIDISLRLYQGRRLWF